MTGEGSHLAPVDDDQRAIAVMLDLMDPSLSDGGSGTSVGISGLINPKEAGDEGIPGRSLPTIRTWGISPEVRSFVAGGSFAGKLPKQ
jgi:hypothetical protein